MLIVSLMMSVTLTSARSFRHRAEVRGSADRYVAKHALARAVAVRSGRTTLLQVDTAGRRMWLEVQRTATARDTVGVMDYFDNRLTLRSDRAVLCFDGRGLAKSGGSCDAPNATVIFTLAGRADTVRVSAVGRIVR
jgi:Tfp pilus assembly protein FimT